MVMLTWWYADTNVNFVEYLIYDNLVHAIMDSRFASPVTLHLNTRLTINNNIQRCAEGKDWLGVYSDSCLVIYSHAMTMHAAQCASH